MKLQLNVSAITLFLLLCALAVWWLSRGATGDTPPSEATTITPFPVARKWGWAS